MVTYFSWLEQYVADEPEFESQLVFCETKLKELFEITAQLPKPNSFRTWICCDLLMKVTPFMLLINVH